MAKSSRNPKPARAPVRTKKSEKPRAPSSGPAQRTRPAYWREEVGRSGIYPMSGPMPPGDAPLRGEMEFGQGERGAAGYNDAGGSELVFSGGQLLGGLSAGPGGAPEGEKPTRTRTSTAPSPSKRPAAKKPARRPHAA